MQANLYKVRVRSSTGIQFVTTAAVSSDAAKRVVVGIAKCQLSDIIDAVFLRPVCDSKKSARFMAKRRVREFDEV